MSTSVVSVNEITDHTQLTKYFIYEKSFYLKAGSKNSNTVAQIKRTYDVALFGIESNNKSDGCKIYKSASGNETAANAIRISFTVENGDTYVYEPNSNVHNTDTSKAGNSLDRS